MTSFEELQFRISADTSRLGNPLHPFQQFVEEAQEEVKHLSNDLDTLDRKSVEVPVVIDVKKEALAKVRAELVRVQKEMAGLLTIDPTLDTKQFEAQINALNRRVRVLRKDIDEELNKKSKGFQFFKEEDVNNDILRFGANAVRGFGRLAERSGIQFVTTFGRAITAAGPEGAVVIGAALSAVMIAALGIVGSSIVAGGGFLGLTAGVIAAFQDPAVKFAAAEFGESILAQFTALGRDLRGPTIAFLDDLKEAFAIFSQPVGPEIAKLGGILDAMGEAAKQVAAVLGPAFARLLAASGPALTEVIRGFEELGGMAASFLNVLSQNSRGVAIGIRALFLGIEAIILPILGSIELAVMAFNVLGHTIDWVNDKIEGLPIWAKSLVGAVVPMFNNIGSAAGMSSEGVDKLSDAQKRQAEQERLNGEAHQEEIRQQAELKAAYEQATAAAQAQTQALAAMFSETFNRIHGFDSAIVSLSRGWLSLGEDLGKSAATLDLNTEAGIDNTEALLNQLAALGRVRDATVANKGSILDANAGYLSGIERLRQFATDAGLAADEVDALIGKYATIPDEQITEIKAKFADSANPDILYAELVKTFGEPVAQKILAEVDTESVTLAKNYFGSAFGDPVAQHLMAQTDADGFQEFQRNLGKLRSDTAGAVTTLTVRAEPEHFELVDNARTRWGETVSFYVTPLVDTTAVETVNLMLYVLGQTRYPLIVPTLDQTAFDAVKAQLSALGTTNNVRGGGTSDNTFGGGIPAGNAVAPSTVVVRPRLYIDGTPVKALVRTDAIQAATTTARAVATRGRL